MLEKVDRAALLEAVEKAIENTGMFIVDIRVTPSKEITVEVDSAEPLDIEACTNLTRAIQEQFAEGALDDYDMEVGSAGLTAPFKVRGQWEKNLGNDIELLLKTGSRKLTAKLVNLGDTDFTVEYEAKEKQPGEKRPKVVTRQETIPFEDVRRAAYALKM